MSDLIVDAAAAQGLQAYAKRTYRKVSWIIMRNQAGYPDEFVARLINDAPTAYVLVADNLPGLQAQLPTGLVQSDRQAIDPPEVVEMWLAE